MHPEERPDDSASAPLRNYRGLLPALDRLTPRQNEILHWLCEGHSCGEIAIILGRSERTVGEQLRTIYHALGVEGALPAVTTIHHAIEDACLALIEALAAPLPRRPRRQSRGRRR